MKNLIAGRASRFGFVRPETAARFVLNCPDFIS